MAIETIDIGTAPNDGTGDPLRTAFTKCNNNFIELESGTGGVQTDEANTWTATQSFTSPLTVIGPAATDREIEIETTGAHRDWVIVSDSAAGNFQLRAYSDADALLRNQWTVNRATGDGVFAGNFQVNANTGAPFTSSLLQAVGADGGSTAITLDSYGASAPSFNIRRAAGTQVLKTPILNTQSVGGYFWSGYGTTAYNSSFQGIICRAIEDWTDTAAGARHEFYCSPVGVKTLTQIFSADHTSGLRVSSNTVIDPARLVQFRAVTLGTLVTSAVGKAQYATDLGGGAGLLLHDGTVNRRAEDGGYATIATDAAFTLTPLTNAPKIRHTGTLTAARAVTLSTTGAYAGCTFRITRTGTGAFALNVGTGPLKALSTNQWGLFEYDGAAWYLAEFGSL